MKDELKDEHKLKKHLDMYKVHIPTEKLCSKQTIWQRFIKYLASPVQNPLDKPLDTVIGLRSSWILPVVSGVFLTIIQLFLYGKLMKECVVIEATHSFRPLVV